MRGLRLIKQGKWEQYLVIDLFTICGVLFVVVVDDFLFQMCLTTKYHID